MPDDQRRVSLRFAAVVVRHGLHRTLPLVIEARDERREFQRLFRGIVRLVLETIRQGPIIFERLAWDGPAPRDQRSAQRLCRLRPRCQFAACSSCQQCVGHAIGADGGFPGHSIINGKRRFRTVESSLQTGDAKQRLWTGGGLPGQRP
jgi:hypothetical protein